MPDITPFPGFSEPSENYFRLPNNWFALLNHMRQAHGDRFAAPLKMLEYLLKHTWGASRFNGSICLSADEIRNGRRGRNRQRIDTGTGLSENAIRDAGLVLAEIGFINISQDTTDMARRLRTYQIRLAEPQPETGTESEFAGFDRPQENYFKVAKSWTDLTRSTNSAATIVVVEYLFRHTWGFQNADGEWLTIDEIVNGRLYKTSAQRYDTGTGFGLATVYRALNEAIGLKLVVFKDEYERGITTRLFNLRLAGMNADQDGRWLENPILTTEAVILTNEVVVLTKPPQMVITTEDAILTTEVVIRTDEAVNIADEARSVKDTHQDTSKKHQEKTPSTDEPAKNRTIKPDVVAADVLPENIRAGLEQIGWSDTTTEIRRFYASNPELVVAWLDFALHVGSVHKSRAAFFRKGLRSGEMPPYRIETPARQPEPEMEQEEDMEIFTEPEFDAPAEAVRAWDALLNQLSMEMPRAVFDSKVRETRVMDYCEGLLSIWTDSTYTRDWLENRLKSTVERQLAGIFNRPIEVAFIAASSQG